jgi:hypothetical protein
MKRYISLLVTMLAVAAVSAVAVASASAAEPTILFLSPETFPVKMNANEPTTATELQNAAGSLKGEGFTLEMEETATTKTYTVDFTNVKKGTESCNSPGDAAGVVLLVKNPYQLAFDSLSPLGVAALFTVEPELTVECGATKVKIKGNVLGLVTPIETEGTAFKGILHCSATVGEPAEVKYWPNSGTETTALLLANFGTGFKKACENVAGEVSLTSSKMITIMG